MEDHAMSRLPVKLELHNYITHRREGTDKLVSLLKTPPFSQKETIIGSQRHWTIARRGNSRQGNAMLHNYWSHKHIADRLKWTAEECGIKIETVSEAYTSQTCPRCHSRHSLRVLRGFRCLDCGLEAHRDAVGVLNMGARCGGYAVRPMVWPMLLHWDGAGMKREPEQCIVDECRCNIW